MAKIKHINVTNKYVSEFDDNVFSCDESILSCKLCKTKVNAEGGT